MLENYCRRFDYSVGVFLCCRWVRFFWAAFAILATGRAQVSENTGNRYLIAVDVSRSMQTRLDGTTKTIRELLSTGMHGQMRRGDTLGVWTFNESLYTGRFPLQYWSNETKEEISDRVLKFLSTQKHEQQPRLAPLLFAIQSLVERSDSLTVIVLSAGTEKFEGTPFDLRINDYYQQWQTQQQKARMPFVTVLRANQGKLTDYAVACAPWPVEIPALPNAIRPPLLTQKTTVPPSKKPQAAPLIISGRKPDTNQITKSEVTTTAVPAELPKSLPPQSATTSPVNTIPIPPPAPDTATAAKTLDNPSSNTPLKPLEKPPEKSAVTLEHTEVKSEPPALSEPTNATSTASATESRPTKVSDSLPPPSIPAPNPTALPKEAIGSPAPPTAPSGIDNQPSEPEPLTPTPPTNQVAVVAESGNGLSHNGTLVLAGLLGATLIAAAWLLTRRFRSAPPASSLISQSMKRKKKE